MKIQIITFLALFPVLIFGQKNGVISYTQTIKIDLSGRDLPKEILEAIPKERISHKELIFTENESSYKNVFKEEDNEEVQGGGGGMKFRMRMMGGNEKELTYKNLADKKAIDQKDLMGKLFRINMDLEDEPWKVTGEKKIIFKYMALEATTIIQDTVLVTAWFTPQIPVSNGPEMFGGLPGMILEVSIGEKGDNIIRTTEISLRDIEDNEIIMPDEGKEVSREEFRKIRKEKMAEMKEMRGERGRGGHRIITRGGK